MDSPGLTPSGEEPGPNGVQRAAAPCLLHLWDSGAGHRPGGGRAAPQQGGGTGGVPEQEGGPGGLCGLPGGTLCTHQEHGARRGGAIRGKLIIDNGEHILREKFC